MSPRGKKVGGGTCPPVPHQITPMMLISLNESTIINQIMITDAYFTFIFQMVSNQVSINLEKNGHGSVGTKTDHQNGTVIISVDDKTSGLEKTAEIHENDGYTQDITPVEMTDTLST